MWRAFTIILVLAVTSRSRADFTQDIGKLVFKQDNQQGLSLSSAIYWNDEHAKHFSAALGVRLTPEMLAASWPVTSGEGIKIHITEKTTLELQPSGRAGECSSVIWTSQDLMQITDCVNYGDAQWYGAFEQKEQLWPIQKLVKENYAYITQELDNMGVAERYFLNSEGVYIYIEPYVPLFIDANATGENQLCFTARFEEPFKPVTDLRLHYDICSLPNAIEAHKHAANSVLNAHPTDLPDERMVRDPIWSTWVRYKRNVNETIILNFAQEILDHGYNNSQLEIDDDWETCYGELTFDSEKFPDPAGLSRRLKQLGFRVTLWIHPFINENCPSYDTVKQLGYLTSDENGNTRTSWWNGRFASIIDFSNPEATAWFLERLRALKSLSEVDSFKFDAGETSWLPKPRELTGEPSLQPNSYTAEYARALAEFGPLAEVRVGFQTQDIPLFVRMVDKDSHWRWDNGLKSVVTTLLAMNMAGYPYVLPDMIGGNSYNFDIITKELFVRWLQASTFMPSIQFSYVPWDFNDPEIEAICKTYVNLHAEYATMIMDLASSSMLTGMPINTPVWFADLTHDDQEAFKIDDQYMLGPRILVAPVMEKDAVTRDIYLPPGSWRDMNLGMLVEGGQWIRDYPAPLDVLPFFRKESDIVSGAQMQQVMPLVLLACIAVVNFFKA